MKTTILAMILLTSTVAFARIHDDCKVGTNVANRGFAIGYTGSVIDLKTDETKGGKKVYLTPALNYEQAFGEVCKVIDEHPELWNRPSREAVTFAINVLWKRKD